MLSDAKARKLEPGSKALTAGVVPGLYLFPASVRGRGKWIFRFVSPVTGKRRDMGLGSYPEIGIADARQAAMAARQAVGAGSDPIELRKAAAETEAKTLRVPTFAEAARSVHAELAPGFRNRKHADHWLTSLEMRVFPVIGDRTVDTLKASDFADALRPIWLKLPETASRVRQRCDTVMKWCAARDFVMASPVSVVDALLPRQPGKRERTEHHPAVPWRAMPALVQTLFRGKPPTTGRLALEFLILTAARSGEVRGMSWAEVDMDAALWTIPASRMKAKAQHRVPLTPRGLEILTQQRCEWDGSSLVFPSRRNTPISDMTLTKLLRDASIRSDTDGRIATAHGFRSTFRDWASENGYSRDLAERALAHTVRNATEAAYHRTDLLDQRRPMMEAWARLGRQPEAACKG